MERKSLEEGAPLLVGRQKDDTFGIGDSEAEIEIDSSVTPVFFLSAFVVICGNLAFGCAEGYSSPAQFGIMEDLGVSSAEPSRQASLKKCESYESSGGVVAT